MPHARTFLGWYVHRDGHLTGPMTADEIRKLVVVGDVHPAEEILKAYRDGYGQVRFFGSHASAAVNLGHKHNHRGDATMLRVLIVDDCKDGADSLALLLQMWGHEVQVAYDGPSALRLADAFRPEVFLLDVGLPGMDGFCLARQLRERADFQSALVIAVSGHADLAQRARGAAAGFDDYLVKPTDPTTLQEMLAKWGAFHRPAEGLTC